MKAIPPCRLACAVLAAVLGAGCGSTAASLAAAAPERDRAVDVLDEAHRLAFEARCDALGGRAYPRIVVVADAVVCEQSPTQWTRGDLSTPRSRLLLAIGRVPLSVQLLVDGPLDDDVRLLSLEERGHLAGLARRIDEAEAALPAAGLDEERRERQLRILHASRGLVQELAVTGRLTLVRWNEYRERVAPLVLANAMDAGATRAALLHETVAGWRGQLSDDEWERTRVAVLDRERPRDDHFAVAYFEKLFDGVPGPDDAGWERVVHRPFDGASRVAIDACLAAPLVRARTAEALFDDPSRLRGDLVDEDWHLHLDDRALPLR